jgi:hypothetical protein
VQYLHSWKRGEFPNLSDENSPSGFEESMNFYRSCRVSFLPDTSMKPIIILLARIARREYLAAQYPLQTWLNWNDI